jgi:hypothetical protein
VNYYDRLSREERAEIDAAVHESYTRPDGSVRDHREADEMFDRFITDALQAQRAWATHLLDGWRIEGRRAFLKSRWKNGRLFDLVHKGKVRRRAERRGTQVRNDDGRQVWVQDSLLAWSVDQLDAAISQTVGRVEEERANLAMYRTLRDLLVKTGGETLGDALAEVGMSLQEYLAQRAA